MSRILVTGASGLLGSNLARDFAARHAVTGVVHRHMVGLPKVRIEQADLSEAGSAKALFEGARPELVIHCAAAAQVDACERDPEMARRLNRDMAGLVAAAAAQAGARLIHISTDAVFGGSEGGYEESDPPNPVNEYGRSKLEGEAAVREACPEALIVRTTLFGWNLPHKRNLAEWFLERLSRDEQCPGFTDVWFSPILVNQLGGMLLELAETGAAGVLHVAGATCLSKYEFGRKLAEAFGLEAELVRPSEVSAGGLGASRGQRLCLDSGAAERVLGRSMPSIDEGIQAFQALRGRSAIPLMADSPGGHG